jgi:phage shock protein PspC (stress-responsive transcriptional regulator)
MTDPTSPQPPSPAPPPRRLTRSNDDRIIGGVAGGLGRHLDIDPLAIRITFVILSFAGGLGLLAYLLCLAFVPAEGTPPEEQRWGVARTLGAALIAIAALAVLLPSWAWGPAVPLLTVAGVIVYLLLRVVREQGGPPVGRIAAKIAIGIVLLALSAGAFAAAAAGSALGGGVAVAGLVIACGVGLAGGAFRGGARWLIAPALVLALPLGAVAATDLDLRGTWGDRTFTPTSIVHLNRGYEMGAGSMHVDLREVDVPAGRTVLPLKLGMGEIQVIADPDVCLTTEAKISLGGVDSNGDKQGGADLDVDDDIPVGPDAHEVHVVADLGIGHLLVGEEPSFSKWPEGPGVDPLYEKRNRINCRGAA